jgi:hypothetical protein
LFFNGLVKQQSNPAVGGCLILLFSLMIIISIFSNYHIRIKPKEIKKPFFSATFEANKKYVKNVVKIKLSQI